MGVVAIDSVIGLMWVEVHADSVFEDLDFRSGAFRQMEANEFASGWELVEGGEGVLDHSCEVERAGGLVESPQGLGAVCVEFIELM
jgi:coenzyme F420-reducing hydrogenase alpha subunit